MLRPRPVYLPVGRPVAVAGQDASGPVVAHLGLALAAEARCAAEILLSDDAVQVDLIDGTAEIRDLVAKAARSAVRTGHKGEDVSAAARHHVTPGATRHKVALRAAKQGVVALAPVYGASARVPPMAFYMVP